jgi:hypothetical protein
MFFFGIRANMSCERIFQRHFWLKAILFSFFREVDVVEFLFFLQEVDNVICEWIFIPTMILAPKIAFL